MHRLMLLAPIALIAAAPADSHDAMMTVIESKVVMPAGAEPLDHYARYYATLGDGTVTATYLALDKRDKPGRQWVTPEKLPLVFDGGCGVVRVSYDPKAQRVTRIRCNGIA